MTEVPEGGQPGDRVVRETVTERVMETVCPACGTTVVPSGRGRPARYCSQACRQKAWALRAAERALGTAADRRPTVIRDVIDRHTERVIERKAAVTEWAVAVNRSSTPGVPAPTDARGWVTLLTELAGQLADANSPVAAQHFNHARLEQALRRAYEALNAAHPGGLGHAR